jgi:preprotein translocase subunit SecE
LDGAGSLGPGSGSMSRSFGVLKSELNSVAKTTPIEFIRQVQAETKKVVWPSRRETIMTGVMVMIMTTLLAVFFFGIDTIFEAVVKMLLSLAN